MKNDWEIKTLGEACEFISRGISPSYVEQSGLLVVNQKCIRNHVVDFSLARQHNETTKKVSSEKLIQKGDVLINSTGTGTLGRVAQVITDTRASVDSHVTIVRPNKNLLDERFFAWALFNIENKIAESGEGASGQTELARETVRNFIISYPLDKQEQKRIVKILDEKFEAIDELKRVAEQQIIDAKELFESKLNNIFNKCAQESNIAKFEDLFDITSSKRVMQSDWRKTGVPFYRARELVKIKAGLALKDPIFISEDLYESNVFKYGKPKVGDLLVTAVGTLGVTYVVDDNRKFYFKDGNIIWFKNKNKTNTKYVEYFFLTDYLQKQIEDAPQGATVGTYTIERAKQTVIPLPDKHNQSIIVKELDELSEKTKELGATFRRKIADLGELKKSYLEQAFSGKL